MAEYRVTGGRRLCGSVTLPAAKNSVLPLMAAALLCDGPVRLQDVPALSDVEAAAQLHRAVGADCARQNGAVTVTPAAHWQPLLPPALAGAMRGSVFYLGPLLAAAGQVTMPLPGGCRLGPRKIDLHLDGLLRMGARLHWHGDWITLERRGRLRGVDYTLRLPSVGATETLLMAAATAKGITVLRGAACEPEVRDLAGFLNRCGARVRGAGGPVITVAGVESLAGCSYRPLSDRIVACTYAAAAAAAGGSVALVRCQAESIAPFVGFLRRLGCHAAAEGDVLTVSCDTPPRGDTALTATAYPGFATDALPLAAAVCLRARGRAVLADTLFENRFACAQGFAAMGARVRPACGGLEIEGGAPLHGAAVTAPDLRGGAALVLAALAAQGVTTVRDSGFIRRGYEDLAGGLAALGAKAALCEVQDAPHEGPAGA